MNVTWSDDNNYSSEKDEEYNMRQVVFNVVEDQSMKEETEIPIATNADTQFVVNLDSYNNNDEITQKKYESNFKTLLKSFEKVIQVKKSLNEKIKELMNQNESLESNLEEKNKKIMMLQEDFLKASYRNEHSQ